MSEISDPSESQAQHRCTFKLVLKLKYLILMRFVCVRYQKCDLLEKGHFPVTSFKNREKKNLRRFFEIICNNLKDKI